MAIASIKSTRNSDPATSLVDSSREDVLSGDVITLESIGAGVTTHSWSIMFSPDGSSASLTSTNAAVTQFAIDEEGSYLLRLIVDAGLPTEHSMYVRHRVLTQFAGLQLVAAGERRDEEAIIPNDIGIYGWAYEQNGNLRKILEILKPIAVSGRVVHVDSNLGTQGYGDFATIQEAIDFSVLDGASESQPYVVLINEGVYEETLTLQPFVHLVGTQHKSTQDVPDLTAKPKLSPRVVVKSEVSHDATLTVNSELTILVGLHFLCEATTANPMFAKTGEGVLQANACTFESTVITVGQGALIDLQEGRFVGLDCRFRMDETGDIGNFAFLQSGEDTTSLLDSCVFTAPSCLAINPNQHNVGGVINVLRDCIVSSAQYGLATNGTSTVINSSLRDGVENLSINWLGSSYGVSNSGNSIQTVLFSEIEGDIYWNKDNTSHNNILKVGSVVFETLNESGTGSAISVEALANALSISFDNTVSSLVSTNVQDAISELEGLLANKVESATNIGTGSGIFKQKTGTDLELRSVLGTGGINVALSGTGDELEISYTGAGVSNQINQDDSSVVVTDTGVLATIDFTINATNEWRIDGVGDLLSMSGGALGSSASYIPSLYLDALQWDVTTATTAGVGQMTWNDTAGTMDIGLKGGNVTLQVGQEEVFRAVNDDTVQINDGQAVFISGANGGSGKLKVQLASYDNTTAHNCIGLATENLTHPNGEGFVTTFGLVRGIDTSGLTGSVGDIVYLEANGDLTTVKPDAGTNIDHRTVEVGYLVKKAVNGQIFVRVREVHLESWQEDVSGNLLPLQNNAFNIGSPSYIVNSIYANAYNSIRFIDPSTTDEFHFRVDTTSSIPRMKIGDMFVTGIPDTENMENMPPEALTEITSMKAEGFRPLLWDVSGNGQHLLIKDAVQNVSPSVLKLGGKEITTIDSDSILSTDDAHDTFMVYSTTTNTWGKQTKTSLVLPYNNLTNKPTALSDFTNDVGFLTTVGDINYQTISNTPSNLSEFNNDLTISYNALSDRPSLFSGDYNDLSNQPNLFDGAYSSLTGTPTNVSAFTNDAGFLSSVDYGAITNTPTIPTNVSELTNDSGYLTSVGSISYNDLTNKPTLFDADYNSLSNQPSLFSGVYNDLTGKPSIPSAINDLSMPSGGANGDVLTRNGNDVEYTDTKDIHSDSIYAHSMLAQGNPTKPVTAEFGKLHLISLVDQDVTLDLPAASSVGNFKTIKIKLIERVGEWVLTIKPDGTDEIDKANADIVWNNNNFLMKSITLYSDGSNWWLI